ncbi:hypothetical protein B0H10DRAFT_1351369 [Mycena sp. CBHHK59/15]|nr:hypothetical protein B0H10DRAFT_1351369 [Mycena sp. CBHHK59/15]
MDPLDPESRDDRGIYNEHIGGLLCPTELNYADEEIRTRIREGDQNAWSPPVAGGSASTRITSSTPRTRRRVFSKTFCYSWEVWKYIFTLPVSVKHTLVEESENLPRASDKHEKRKEKAKVSATPKRSVAAIIGLTRVTGRSIAYAAVQYRVALSDQHHWEENDGSFDYVEFYNNVVDYFEFPPGPIAKLDVERLLDWWNSAVFKHKTKWSLYEGGTAPTSSVMQMNAARAAREVGMTSIPDMS